MIAPDTVPVAPADIEAAAWRAIHALPPAWPLDATVAVNPYLGQSGLDLAATAARIGRVYGAPVTMPGIWYAARIDEGSITRADLLAALAEAPAAVRALSVEDLIQAARQEPAALAAPLDTVADIAARETGIDWPAILTDRLTIWAGGYFDQGQALWRAPRNGGAYGSWRLTATHDLTPEILGLAGFASHVAETPVTATGAIERAVRTLGISGEGLERYFHRALASLGGWAQLARQKLWNAEMAGGADHDALGLLAARLVWEEALLGAGPPAVGVAWGLALPRYAEPDEPTEAQLRLTVLQTAHERAAQRRLFARLGGRPAAAGARPALQAAFCIDVRSEVFRRALESLDGGIRTLGFAGFFGLGVEHRRFASDLGERRLPVLLNPALHTGPSPTVARSEWLARIADRGVRAWGRFKLAAVSSFAFVEASGPFYAAKLLGDSIGLAGKKKREEPPPRFAGDLSLETRADMAETVLRAMSLTADFAPLVLLVGHGASVVNNPHASGLHCGACGGYPGDVNARLLAGLLNASAVRGRLADRGLAIPADTLFVAGLHDTTTDKVQLFAGDGPVLGHREDLSRARAWLEAAGRLARAERALRLPGATDGRGVARRARDWSEVRPEWALAGCQGFIAAPREATARADLGGRVFLHDYAWPNDREFKVLELILTAPVVVASWISLQYYGSTVSPGVFGSGDKLLHNVVGGIGVLEGGTGPLRVGLSRQAVHDGSRFVHDPLRLSVCIAAPREAMADILGRHPTVKDLFDNSWLNLFAMDDEGRVAFRYRRGLLWEPVRAESEADVTQPVAA